MSFDVDGVARRFEGVPSITAQLQVAGGPLLYGFQTDQRTALSWWRSFASVADETGLQPLVIDAEASDYLLGLAPMEPAADVLARAAGIDGGDLLAAKGPLRWSTATSPDTPNGSGCSTVVGSDDKQPKAKLCCVEIDEIAVAFGPPT
jgi:hypothetical protein